MSYLQRQSAICQLASDISNPTQFELWPTNQSIIRDLAHLAKALAAGEIWCVDPKVGITNTHHQSGEWREKAFWHHSKIWLKHIATGFQRKGRGHWLQEGKAFLCRGDYGGKTDDVVSDSIAKCSLPSLPSVDSPSQKKQAFDGRHCRSQGYLQYMLGRGILVGSLTSWSSKIRDMIWLQKLDVENDFQSTCLD